MRRTTDQAVMAGSTLGRQPSPGSLDLCFECDLASSRVFGWLLGAGWQLSFTEEKEAKEHGIST